MINDENFKLEKRAQPHFVLIKDYFYYTNAHVDGLCGFARCGAKKWSGYYKGR